MRSKLQFVKKGVKCSQAPSSFFFGGGGNLTFDFLPWSCKKSEVNTNFKIKLIGWVLEMVSIQIYYYIENGEKNISISSFLMSY